MTIAVAETLIELNGDYDLPDELLKEKFVFNFVNCFKRDWRNGYARGFQKFLNEIKNHKEFLEKNSAYF